MADAIPPGFIPDEFEELPDGPENSRLGLGRRPGRKPGRKKGVANKVTRDLRESLLASWHKLGGRDYAVWLARVNPPAYVSLISRIIPTETKLSVLASYQGIPVTVEDRDAPLLANAPDMASYAVSQVIEGSLLKDNAAADDWLALSPQ